MKDRSASQMNGSFFDNLKVYSTDDTQQAEKKKEKNEMSSTQYWYRNTAREMSKH